MGTNGPREDGELMYRAPIWDEKSSCIWNVQWKANQPLSRWWQCQYEPVIAPSTTMWQLPLKKMWFLHHHIISNSRSSHGSLPPTGADNNWHITIVATSPDALFVHCHHMGGVCHRWVCLLLEAVSWCISTKYGKSWAYSEISIPLTFIVQR